MSLTVAACGPAAERYTPPEPAGWVSLEVSESESDLLKAQIHLAELK